jgi:hypothetical protein
VAEIAFLTEGGAHELHRRNDVTRLLPFKNLNVLELLFGKDRLILPCHRNRGCEYGGRAKSDKVSGSHICYLTAACAFQPSHEAEDVAFFNVLDRISEGRSKDRGTLAARLPSKKHQGRKQTPCG